MTSGLRHCGGCVTVHKAVQHISGCEAVVRGQAVVDLAHRGVCQANRQGRWRDGDGVVGICAQAAGRARSDRGVAAWQAVVAGFVHHGAAIEHIAQRDGGHVFVARHACRTAGERAEIEVLALDQIAKRHIGQTGGAVIHLGGRDRQRTGRDGAVVAADGASGQRVVGAVSARQADFSQGVSTSGASIRAGEVATNTHNAHIVTAHFACGGSGCGQCDRRARNTGGAIVNLGRRCAGGSTDGAGRDSAADERRSDVQRIV